VAIIIGTHLFYSSVSLDYLQMVVQIKQGLLAQI